VRGSVCVRVGWECCQAFTYAVQAREVISDAMFNRQPISIFLPVHPRCLLPMVAWSLRHEFPAAGGVACAWFCRRAAGVRRAQPQCAMPYSACALLEMAAGRQDIAVPPALPFSFLPACSARHASAVAVCRYQRHAVAAGLWQAKSAASAQWRAIVVFAAGCFMLPLLLPTRHDLHLP